MKNFACKLVIAPFFLLCSPLLDPQIVGRTEPLALVCNYEIFVHVRVLVVIQQGKIKQKDPEKSYLSSVLQ